MDRKTVRTSERAFGSGLSGHRPLLAAGAVGLAFVAAHAGAEEDEHQRACMCMRCASGGGNIVLAEPGEATEEGEPEVSAFQADDSDRWTRFASGTSFVRGDPVTLTFGLVTDGTSISGETSNLRSFLNSAIGSSDTWLPLVQDGYQRWAEVSGITFIYEENDDGALSPNTSGRLGTRADLRLGGHAIDGSTIGFNYFPNFGDGVLDTSEAGFFGRSFGNYRTLRNTIAHEVGHGIGISHFESNNSSGLMEPFINTSFDGPQHGDILAVQRLYGDALEADGGNDTTGNATGLGSFSGTSQQTLSIGTDADDNTEVVGADETDFISIDGTSDTDVFAFSLDGSNSYNIDIQLDPKGPTYNQGPQGGTQSSFNTKALTNLELELLDSSGIVVATADANGAGTGESIQINGLAAGDYFARVSTGQNADDQVQFYRLDVSAAEVVPVPSSFTGAHLAYRGSSFDSGSNIASDKSPLLNGETAAFENYSSYDRGINRVVVDIQGLPGDGSGVGASDFLFRVGNDNAPGDWADAPAPTGVSVVPGGGAGGSDRVLIDWADDAIVDEWLQVTVLSNDDTALPVDMDIDTGDPATDAGAQFYFGNARYEAGSAVEGVAEVNFFDVLGPYRNQATGVPISNIYDYNRDGAVNFFDVLGAYRNQQATVQLITPPGSGM